jgi:hypothetical protein
LIMINIIMSGGYLSVLGGLKKVIGSPPYQPGST